MRTGKDGSALWFWPWTMANAHLALVETMLGAPAVIAARMPVIDAAMRTPWMAHTAELTRMVTEKTDAFGRSGRSMASAAQTIRAAGDGNARDLGKLAGGGFLWPADYARMAERNLAAFAALATLPGSMIGPIHKRVSANARRLR